MKKSVLLETSARHAHLSRRVLDILFGEGYELTHKKDLSQPGQFATNERIQVLAKGQFPQRIDSRPGPPGNPGRALCYGRPFYRLEAALCVNRAI